MAKSTDTASNFSMYTTAEEGYAETGGMHGSSVSLDTSTVASSTSSTSGVGTTTAKIEYDGSNRMLSEVLLNPLRPELLAVMDLTPLLDYNDENTSFYEYANSKLSIRSADAATAANILSGVQASSPEEFTKAITQYETSLASAASELELLKLTYMLKNYMILGTNFRDFLEVFDYDSSTTPGVNLGISDYGVGHWESVNSWLPDVFGFRGSSSGDATTDMPSAIYFANVIQQLSFITAIGAPAAIFNYDGIHTSVETFPGASSANYVGVQQWLSDASSCATDKQGWNLATIGHKSHWDKDSGENFSFLHADKTSRIITAFYGENLASSAASLHAPCTQVFSSIIGSNLNVSYSIKQCNLTSGGHDTVLWDILQKRAGAAVSMNPLGIDNSIFLSLAGWDPYLRTRKDGSKLANDCMINNQFLPDLTMFKNGVMGDAYDEEICYVSKHDVLFTNTSGDSVNVSGIKKTVNEAFGSETGRLSFGNYEKIAKDLQDSTLDLGVALGKMHRSGKYQNLSSAEQNNPSNKPGGEFANFPQNAFDPGSVLRACMETFSERFAQNFEKTYLWYGFQQSDDTTDSPQSFSGVDAASTMNGFSQPAVSHIKKFASLMAYGIINSDNEQNNNSGRANGLAVAKTLAESFIKDYHAGYLTFDIEEEEVIDFAADADGNFVETSFWVKKNKSPLTGGSLSLRGTKSAVWSSLMPRSSDAEKIGQNDGHSIYYEVADLNCSPKYFCITSDGLDLYTTPALEDHDPEEVLGGYDSTYSMAGWLQWAPVYTPGASSTARYKNPRLFTKMINNIQVTTPTAPSNATGAAYYSESTADLKQVLNSIMSSTVTLAQGQKDMHDRVGSVTTQGFSPKDTPYEACNMFKYSWHWARDYSDETDVDMVPLLANLWTAEIIEMCLRTMQKLLANRGHIIGGTSSSDLSFPQYAYSSPYCDSGGYADILSDGVSHNGGNEVDEFPFDECFWNTAAFDDDNPTGINFKKWVPTMNALQENFCRSDGTLMSGQSLSTLFSHIIDNMALLMKQTYPFFHVAYLQGDSSGANTRWPILGTYGEMFEVETLEARKEAGAAGKDKPSYVRRGPPIRPKVLFPYWYQAGGNHPGNVHEFGKRISSDLREIVDIHEVLDSMSTESGGAAYSSGDIIFNQKNYSIWTFIFTEGGTPEGDYSTFQTDSIETYPDNYLINQWGMAASLLNTTYEEGDISSGVGLKTALKNLVEPSELWSDSGTTNNPRASLIYNSLYAALTGNPKLFGYGHDKCNIVDPDDGETLLDYAGRGIAILEGQYDNYEEHIDFRGDNVTAPKYFWTSWWISAVPKILAELQFVPVTTTTTGDAGWLYGEEFTDSVSSNCAFGAIFNRVHPNESDSNSAIWASYGPSYAFSNGDLLGAAPGLSYAPGGSYWRPNARGFTPNVFGRVNGSTSDARFNASNDTRMSQMYWIASHVESIYKGLVLSCKEPHYKAVAFNVMEKFGRRIKDYSGTAIEAFAGDGGSKNLEPVIDFIKDLARAEEPGQDILQNLTEQQMALKYLSLYNQKGDPENGLLPCQEIITSNIFKAMRLMFNFSSTVDITRTWYVTDFLDKGFKTMVFGIPSGGVEEFDSSANAASITSISVAGRAIINTNVPVGERYRNQMLHAAVFAYNFEFPHIVLEPYMVPIIPNLFVVKESFDEFPGDIDDMFMIEPSIVANIKFLKVELSVQEGTGEDNQIVVKNDVSFDTLANLYGDGTFTSVDETTRRAAQMILESYLLEKYYKLTSGISINEDTFPSTSDEIGLGINDYASNLTEALASEFSSYNSTVSSAVSQVMDSLVSSVQSYNSVASEFTTALGSTDYSDLSDEILDSATNAAGSRIYSAEKMKEDIIKAKRFDRVFYVRIHPDMFPVRWTNASGEIMGASWTVDEGYGDHTNEEQTLIGSTTFADVQALAGGTTTDPINDEDQWILMTDGSPGTSTLEDMRSEIPALTTADVDRDHGQVIRTGIRFRRRPGDKSINFYRTSVVLLDQSGIGEIS